jgi:nitrite reductase/ring-hydroxylating ferredoxin subunit
MSDDTRRDFLRESGCFVIALTGLGLSPRLLAALPVTTIEGATNGNDRSYPIPASDSVSIDRTNQVIVVRAEGRVFAFALSCPHENAAVKWVEKDKRFQCSKHDSRYQPDGVYRSGRATRNMDRFPIRKDGNTIVIDLDRVFHSDADKDAWAAANVAV